MAPRSDGRGVTVSGYDNLALRALVPPESNLIQIGDDHVENDSQESIQQLFDASDLPMLCVFEMNPVILFLECTTKTFTLFTKTYYCLFFCHFSLF